MFSKVKWRQHGPNSGPLIYGKQKLYIPKESSQQERALFLTALVESGGRLGTVMAYDGTAMTAGISQSIAVYPGTLNRFTSVPEKTQGSLWRLVEKVDNEVDKATANLMEEIEDSIGWQIQKGIVINEKTGKPVHGRQIRAELTPPNGKVPRHGQYWQAAKTWALLFHDVFSDPDTTEIQILDTLDHIERLQSLKFAPLGGTNVSSIFQSYDMKDSPDSLLDAAFAFLISFAVNSPNTAMKVLAFVNATSLVEGKEAEDFALHLLSELKNSKFGNWKRRFVRTRKFAKRIWTPAVISQINKI